MIEKMAFNCKNLRVQKFPFSKKFMEYLVEFANAKIMQKFHRSCKYFYIEAPYFIVDSLDFGCPKRRIENIEYDGCLDFMDKNEFETFLPKIDNIWVTKTMNLKHCGHELIDKIIRCDASEVSIPGKEISFEKFQILTKSKNVEKISLKSVLNSDGSEMPLEDILVFIPNLSYIYFYEKCHVTPETITKLNEIPWKQKIKTFYLSNIDEELDVGQFFNFVKNHLDSYSEITMYFNDYKNNEKFAKEYNKMVEDSFLKMHKLRLSDNSYINRTKMFVKGKNSIIFTVQNIRKQQYFTLPYSMMNYICENSNGKIMAIFYQTCKYFYQKYPFLIVQYINYCKDTLIKFEGNKQLYYVDSNLLKMLDNIWITNRINFNYYEPKEFLNKIVRCDAEDVTFLYDPRQHLPSPLALNAYKFLTKSIKKFDFTCQKISGADGKLISVQELLEFLPNAKSIRAMVQGISRQQQYQQHSTSKVLPPRKFIIEKLDLEFFYESTNIDAHSFWKLIKNTLAPKSYIYLKFCRLTDKTFLPEFKREMKAKIETWRPQNEKPSFTCN